MPDGMSGATGYFSVISSVPFIPEHRRRRRGNSAGRKSDMPTRPFTKTPALCFVLAILFVLSLIGIARGEALTEQQYRALLGETVDYLQSLKGPVGPDEISRVAARFPTALTVRRADGAEIPLDRQGILRRVPGKGAPAAARGRLIRHLESILGQIRGPAPGGPLTAVSPQDRRSALDGIYHRKEFRYLDPRNMPWWRAFFKKIIKRIQAWLRKHIPSLGHVDLGWVVYPFYAVIFILAGFPAWWIFRYLRPAARRTAGTAVPETKVDAPEPDWSAWRRKARKKAGEGAFREAIRALFLSVLMEGGGRGWWTYDPGVTNREHLNRVPDASGKRNFLERLVALHERTWYGMEPAGERDYRASEEWVRRIGAVP